MVGTGDLGEGGAARPARRPCAGTPQQLGFEETVRMTIPMAFGEPIGQGWEQIGELGVAFGLSALIGLERELKQKAAGIRTYTVVGFGAALFMLVSKYGFTDVLLSGKVVLDPSRVAAQIVSGLGFIGGGIIFVKRDSVRGLTTAASVWLTAAVGAAAGAGLAVLAAASTLGYFIAILALPVAARWTRERTRAGWPSVRVQYLDGRGLLRDVLSVVTSAGFLVSDVRTARHEPDQVPVGGDVDVDESAANSVEVTVQLSGKGDVQALVGALTDLDGVLSVASGEPDEFD
jgi:putative Mg2+ transporter-C (MgtC) family protein